MAPQKPGMYHGTLRSNCTYGAEEKLQAAHKTDDDIDEELRKVFARSGTLEMFEDVRSFPQGFDTYKVILFCADSVTLKI